MHTLKIKESYDIMIFVVEKGEIKLVVLGTYVVYYEVGFYTREIFIVHFFEVRSGI